MHYFVSKCETNYWKFSDFKDFSIFMYFSPSSPPLYSDRSTGFMIHIVIIDVHAIIDVYYFVIVENIYQGPGENSKHIETLSINRNRSALLGKIISFEGGKIREG